MAFKIVTDENDWRPVRLQIGEQDEVTSLSDFVQSTHLALAKLQDIHGLEFIKTGWLWIPASTEPGAPCNLIEKGKVKDRLKHPAYKCAASEFEPG